jgi:hypothetical protein
MVTLDLELEMRTGMMSTRRSDLGCLASRLIHGARVARFLIILGLTGLSISGCSSLGSFSHQQHSNVTGIPVVTASPNCNVRDTSGC